MVVSHQNPPAGSSHDSWGNTKSAVEALSTAGNAVGQVAGKVQELTAPYRDPARKIANPWLEAMRNQGCYLTVGDFRQARNARSPAQIPETHVASYYPFSTLDGQISYATTGTLKSGEKPKDQIQAVRERIKQTKQRHNQQLATQQQEQGRTRYTQEGNVVIEEAEKIENSPTGKRMDRSPYYIAVSRLALKEEAKRSKAQQKPLVAPRGRRSWWLPGQFASRYHADKAAGYTGATGE